MGLFDLDQSTLDSMQEVYDPGYVYEKAPEPTPKKEKSMFSLDFIGDIANAIPEITKQFDKDYQGNQLQIAQAQARAAEANASATPTVKNNTPWIIGGGVVVVIIMLVVMMGGKNKS